MKTLTPGDFVETEVVTNRQFVLTHTSSYVVVLEGEEFTPSFYTQSASTTTNGIYKEPFFHSIKSQFYNQEYKTETTQSLGTTLTLIQVSQSLFDEKIKEGSLTLSTEPADFFYRVDSGSGTVYDETHSRTVYDELSPYNPTVICSCNAISSSVLYNILATTSSTDFIDDSVGNLKVSGSDTHIGNVFYEFGSIVITDTGSYSDVGLGGFDLTIRATHRKRTLHFQAPIEPSEFNYSTNPTMRIRGETTFNRPRYSYTLNEVSDLYGQTINENTIIPEFFGFDPSGSEETALTPYVTTIGWYDDIGNLLATAKLATPTPIPRDFPITFKARIDI